jgi:2-oxoglutarate ferredoxin oxidoreductase subunit alpha
MMNHERVYVIENNFDGQMAQLLRIEVPEATTHMRSLALGDGLPMTPRWVYDNVMRYERK